MSCPVNNQKTITQSHLPYDPYSDTCNLRERVIINFEQKPLINQQIVMHKIAAMGLLNPALHIQNNIYQENSDIAQQ